MAVYLSVPIINELVRLVDISTSEDSVQAMGSAILNYYFPVTNGYALKPRKQLHRPKNKRVIPWGPPNQQQQNSFHARHDCITIDWMLRHMAQNDTPPVR
ncbi:hypothetical protein RU639_008150 [Aspergillus parasiticus]